MVVANSVANAIARVRRRGRAATIATQFAIDALAWVVAIFGAAFLRHDFDVTQLDLGALSAVVALTLFLQFFVGWLLHLYRARHPYGSFAETRALFTVVLIVAVVVGLPLVAVGQTLAIPRSTYLIAGPVAFLLMGGARYLKRLLVERVGRSALGSQGTERALIYGAGYLGATMVRRMLTDRQSRFLPVGLVDDSLLRRNTWYDGVRVLGTLADLDNIVQDTGASIMLVAIANADAQVLSDASDAARRAGIQVKVLPPLDQILEGKSRLRDIRDIAIEDIIGRHPIDTDIESVVDYVRGRRVLVTGAGGSIGSELCRQLHRFNPSELIMLDHDESGLQATQLSVEGNGLLDSRSVVLASIRDADAVLDVFQRLRPEVVFHAAALKHVTTLENFPEEAWKTNVLGTLNVLNAARAVGVATFVNISTDKAAQPTSVLGRSKLVAERLTAWFAESSGNRYLSVRFGNVLGSRGSVLPVFRQLIEAGGPVTITDPEVTRYFMTIPEACQLVLQAGAIGAPGEVLILDMGEPIRILDIAHRMIEMSGADVRIVFTGLRDGEKLHEDLVTDTESSAMHRSVHPQISHVRARPLPPGDARAEWESISAPTRGPG